MTQIVIGNVTAVTNDQIIRDACVVIEDGVIVAIDSAPRPVGQTFDGRGAFCLPGVVDTHSDGLEIEPLPRPGANLDRKSTRLNSSHEWISRMPSSA